MTASLVAAAEASGWDLAAHIEPWAIAVTDRLTEYTSSLSTRRVLVIDTTPLAAATAVELLRRRHADAAITTDRPDELGHALVTLERGGSYLGAGVFDLAATMPPLPPEGLSILRRLGEGATYEQIAAAEHLSLTSLKRTIRALKKLHDVDDREALIRAAHRLGVIDTPSSSASQAPSVPR